MRNQTVPGSLSPESAPFVRQFHPEPQRLDEIYSQVLNLIVLGQAWKRLTPLMQWMNSNDIAFAGRMTAEEVQEAVAELQEDEVTKFVTEWADSLNLSAGLMMSKGLQLNLAHSVFPYVNGQGKYSNVYEKAEEIAANFSSNGAELEKDIRAFFVLMVSGLIHAPQFNDNLVDLAVKKMMSNLWNYPTELFQLTDDRGAAISPDEYKLKYRHVVTCLRWLRSLRVNRQLPTDWRLVEREIVDFRHSQSAFEDLKSLWFKLHPEDFKVARPSPHLLTSLSIPN